MLIEPTPPEKMKGARAVIVINATTDQRYRKPAENSGFFADSAGRALTEAIDAGYDSVAYFNVSEYIQRAAYPDDAIEYVYRWVFVPTRMGEEPIPVPTGR